jgi:RNA polymerase sigma-70 factor (ECF subfamily)
MTNVRGRSEQTPAADDASVGSAAAMAARSVVEAQLAARRILERGQRRESTQLAHVTERGLTSTLPLGSGTLAGDALAPRSSPSSAPPPEEVMALFHEYERYVASIGSRILGANNGVDDLVQEVFLVIYQEFHKLRELSSVKAWLATITTRLAWRQRGRPWLYSKLSLNQVEELNPLESTEASPDLQADLAALLHRLRSMPATLREPWMLRFIDGETLPRIAELCDCSQSTVQRRLREAGEVMLGEKAPHAAGGASSAPERE